MAKNSKILVVDDEADVRESIAAFLGNAGFASVDTASGVDDALSKILKKGYDLVVLDLMMPKKSGWGLLEELRARKIKIRVLVASAIGLPDVVRNDLKGKYPAACVDFLSKTNLAEQIEDMINTLLKVPAGVV